MAGLEYLEATSLAEALSFLAAHREEAKLVAGATDLLIDMRHKGLAPRYLVNANRLTDLSYVREEGDGLALGALTRIRDLETSPLLKERYQAIVEAAAQLGSIQIRNLATLGGNLAHATPSAEMAPPLLIHEASVDMAGPDGERSVPLDDFFTGPGTTVMSPDEILTAVRMPALPPDWGAAYLRLCVREVLDIAIVNVAAGLVLTDGKVQELRIALGAVAPTPIRVRKAEAVLAGKALKDGALAEAARVASEEASPIWDVRASAEYRREMVQVLTSRALQVAAERAGA